LRAGRGALNGRDFAGSEIDAVEAITGEFVEAGWRASPGDGDLWSDFESLLLGEPSGKNAAEVERLERLLSEAGWSRATPGKVAPGRLLEMLNGDLGAKNGEIRKASDLDGLLDAIVGTFKAHGWQTIPKGHVVREPRSDADGEEVWTAVCLGLKGDEIDDGDPAGSWALSIFDAFRDQGWERRPKAELKPKAEDHMAALRLWLRGEASEIKHDAARAFVSHTVGLFTDYGWRESKPDKVVAADPVRDATIAAQREMKKARLGRLFDRTIKSLAGAKYSLDQRINADTEPEMAHNFMPRILYVTGCVRQSLTELGRDVEKIIGLVGEVYEDRVPN
jgi:hypothetical protein